VKKKLLKWVIVWGALGLAIPVLLLLRWKMTDSSFGQLEVILWPSSILTMGLEGLRREAAWMSQKSTQP
jgi:hypothetical protein